MQGVGHDDTGVLVLGATNLPWALDPAIRRRFERRIYISLPEFEARLGMLKRGLKDNPHNLTEKDFAEFAKTT
jgi:vacuolar protein-sorting-associated protein 4